MQNITNCLLNFKRNLVSIGLTLSLILIFTPIFSQKYVVKGQVFEKNSTTSVPFANVYMKNSKSGMTTDEDGKFSFYASVLPDTIVISEVGFKTSKIALPTAPSTSLTCYLENEGTLLDEVVVIRYKDPGKTMMRRVIAQKDKNDPNQQTNFLRNNYTKSEIDIKNLSAENRMSLLNDILKIYKGFSADSSNDGLLPIYFIESFYHEFHGKSLQTDAKKLIATKTLGLPTDKLGSKFDRFIINTNIYDGVIPLLKTSFVGPVSALGLTYYHFEIEDTLRSSPHWQYRIKFSPKFKNENTFEGKLWIEDDTYAIKRVVMQTSEGMNLNFVNKISIEQNYTQTKNENNELVWVLKDNKTLTEFESGLDLFGIPVRSDSTNKTIVIRTNNIYDSYQLNIQKINAENYLAFVPKMKHTEGIFDESMRLDSLSMREKSIYLAVDSLKNNTQFKRSARFATFIASGYWDIDNKYRFGPYSSLVSANRVEGIRNRVSFWTMEGINQQWNFNATLAYGWGDNRVKGGVGIKYVPSRDPYRKTEILYRRDYDATTDNDDEVDKDNIFTLALRKNVPNFQVFTEQFKVLQEYDLNHNWSAKMFFNYRTILPTFKFGFYSPEDLGTFSPISQSRLDASEIGINLRYAHNERSSIFNYDKIRIYTRYPVINFHFLTGFEMGQKTHFNYTKFSVGVSQELNIAPKGTFYYNLSAGKTFGTIPYLLMNVPQGNAFFVYSKYTFNNMNPYEFAADRYASLLMRYSMGGLIFDKLPLINKLKWRERLIGNVYWGDMNVANQTYNKLIESPAITTGKTPYAEAGVGIENIFNVFSVDFIWRLNHLNNPNQANITRFGIYTGVKIVF